MSTSRRTFLKSGTMVALAASIPGGVSKGFGLQLETCRRHRALLCRNLYLASLNTRFRIQIKGSNVEMKLTKIDDLKRPRKGKAGASNREGFSLLFEGPHGIIQDSYRFEHDQMGKFDLLMVPVECRKTRGRTYEVIINRLYS